MTSLEPRTPEAAFQNTAGHCVLDFVNTLDERGKDTPLELLPSVERLADWAAQSELLKMETRDAAIAALKNADGLMERCHNLRELIFALLKALIEGREAELEMLEGLQTWCQEAARSSTLVHIEGRLQTRSTSGPLEAVLQTLATEAVALLSDPQSVKAIKLCSARTCDWAFIDRSRRQNRKWCDMSVCGNRAKAKRHAERARRSAG